MFTGLIERTGKILRIVPWSQGKKFLIDPGPGFETSLGDSIALDGACFTVVRKEGDSFWVEISPESLSRTTFRKKKVEDRVNLERALMLSGRLGGHFVLGHIDGIGLIKKVSKKGEFREMEIKVPLGLEKYLVEKGSIAVDGISLTINQILGQHFTVMLIPETIKRTTLGEKKVGEEVNLEMDILGKYVERFLSGKREGITEEILERGGFK